MSDSYSAVVVHSALMEVDNGEKNGSKMVNIIVELRTPAMPVGVGGGKERGGFHLNLRT